MKRLEKFGALLAFISLLWIIGSVGACECGNIGVAQCIVQSVIGIACLWLGIDITNYAGER